MFLEHAQRSKAPVAEEGPNSGDFVLRNSAGSPAGASIVAMVGQPLFHCPELRTVEQWVAQDSGTVVDPPLQQKVM